MFAAKAAVVMAVVVVAAVMVKCYFCVKLKEQKQRIHFCVSQINTAAQPKQHAYEQVVLFKVQVHFHFIHFYTFLELHLKK